MNGILYSMFISLFLRMSVITIFILAIKGVFRYKLSAKMHSLIWLILCVQLIFCLGNISIETDISMYNFIGAPAQEVQPQAISAMQSAAAEKHGFDIKNLIAYSWFFGAVILFIWYVFVFMLHRRRVKRCPLVRDEKILAAFSELKSRLDIYGNVSLRLGGTAMTDADTIIIPGNFPEDEMRQILLHELCHYKNKDCLKLWAAIIILCINWFNPIIWYAFKVFRTDIEMLCDDRVLKITDSKKCYAQALVKSSMKKVKFVPGTTSASNGKHEVVKRVKRIVSWKRKKPVWMIAAICVCVGVSCICLTDAVTVAVENSVDSVSSTPAPAQNIGDIIPIPVSTPETAYEAEETEEPAGYEPSPETESSAVRTTSEQTQTQNSGQSPRDIPQQNSAEQSTSAPLRQNSGADTEPYNPPPAQAQTSSGNVDIEIGSSRDDVYEAMGDPESSSLNGSKETYRLDDETTAVLQYQDGKLEYGYIIDSGSGVTENGGENNSDTGSDKDSASEKSRVPSGGYDGGSSAPAPLEDDNGTQTADKPAPDTDAESISARGANSNDAKVPEAENQNAEMSSETP